MIYPLVSYKAKKNAIIVALIKARAVIEVEDHAGSDLHTKDSSYCSLLDSVPGTR